MTVNSLSLEGEVRTALEALRQMPQKLGELIEEARIEGIRIEVDPTLNSSGKKLRHQEVAQRLLDQVDKLEQAARAYKADIDRYVAGVLEKTDGDPTSELLYEVRLDRAWRRIKAILDSAENRSALVRLVIDLSNDFAKADDTVSVQALNEELESYFRSRNMSTPVEVAQTIKSILVAHASPTERVAIALSDEVSAGYPRLSAAFGMAKTSIMSGSPATVLPGWNSDEKVLMNYPPDPSSPSWS